MEVGSQWNFAPAVSIYRASPRRRELLIAPHADRLALRRA
jgi:hypothetical protein